MADNVKINFEADNKGLDTSITQLEKLGAIAKDNAEQFKKQNAENISASQKRQELIKQETALIQDLEAKKKKAFDPDAIRAYNDDIKKAQSNISTLRGEVDKSATSLNNLGSTLKNVAVSIGLAFGVKEIISFTKEAVNLAAKGEGIRTAFAKIGDEKALEKLRIATRGATSDIDLMAVALRGANFGISTELLAQGLEFAGKRARQTGQDVDYLVNSFIQGIGTRSARVLDNLGIAQADLRKEIKKTGDFNTAVSNLMILQTEKMGEVALTTADKFSQLGTSINNIKERIGQDFISAVTQLQDALVFRFGSEEQKNAIIRNQSLLEQQKKFESFTKAYTSLSNEQLEAQKKVAEGDLKTREIENKFRAGGRAAEILQLQTEIKAIDSIIEKRNQEKNNSVDNIEDINKARQEAENRRKQQEQDRIKDFIEEQKYQQEILKQYLKDNEEAIKISDQRAIAETERGSQEELDAKIKAIQDEAQFKLENQAETEGQRQNIIAESELKIFELKKDFDDKEVREQERLDNEEIQRQEEQNRKLEQLAKQQAQVISQARIETEQAAIDSIGQINQIALDNELNNYQKQLDNKQITQEEYDQKAKAAKKKAAQTDKLLSIFNIGIKTAEAVITALAIPPPAGEILAAERGVVGLIQAALVAATPIPFAKGTKAVRGGIEGKDSVHALVMPGEMIIPTHRKQKYEPILNAIFDEKISPNLLNSLALKGSFGNNIGTDISQYVIKDGMKSALQDGIVVKNMPSFNNTPSIEDYTWLAKRGIV